MSTCLSSSSLIYNAFFFKNRIYFIKQIKHKLKQNFFSILFVIFKITLLQKYLKNQRVITYNQSSTQVLVYLFY